MDTKINVNNILWSSAGSFIYAYSVVVKCFHSKNIWF